MLDHAEYAEAEPFPCMDSISTTMRKKNSKNKRRFSDEQIRSLETLFESESRLEPRKKMQLATELGLQPRQVAIWFQNKRARWKSKQLEREYNILRSNYNNLVSMFESLKKEKQSLVVQLQKLNDLMQRPQEERQCWRQEPAANGIRGESDNEMKPSLSTEISEHGLGVLTDEDGSTKPEYFELEDEPSLLNITDSPVASPDDWGNLNSEGLFDQSNGNSQWWDFWS